MMIKRCTLILSIVYSLWSMVCYAGPISSTELIDNAKQYDGQTVTYSGEVIGDVMARGEYAWVNVNDDTNAVGIWAPKDLTKNIVYKGTYNIKGDIVEIKGVFNRSCTQHGGDLDIHAVSVAKLKDGYLIPEAMDLAKARHAIIFGVILVLVLLWKIYKKFRK
ncbi:MAG: DNA-binding protein [Candidatus Omnitrophica bacterium]|nr:DNA-binding protein [Candidatus Omnitrophota bacterium]